LVTLMELPALRVLGQLPVPVLAVTRDGTILFANDAFAEMLGYDTGHVLTLAFEDVFGRAAQAPCAVSLIRDHAGQLVALSHADGPTVSAIMSRSALERFDDEVALVTFQDITEKLWLEGR
jgi:PAS domain S-box-containing protein